MSAPEMNRAPSRGRPLSPHLSIYKMSRYCLLTSFSNRVTGIVSSLGLLLLLYWLVALAEGARTYAGASTVLSSFPLKAVYAVLLLAFVYHTVAGVRHLIWDTGHGMSREQSQRSAWWVIAISVLVAATLIGWAFLAGTGAR